jgi:hypothetical protein
LNPNCLHGDSLKQFNLGLIALGFRCLDGLGYFRV